MSTEFSYTTLYKPLTGLALTLSIALGGALIHCIIQPNTPTISCSRQSGQTDQDYQKTLNEMKKLVPDSSRIEYPFLNVVINVSSLMAVYFVAKTTWILM